jgi:hypothetical protein
VKIILHIGWRKTGTSAIQHLLYTNRGLLRERYSINYPETGLFGRAHHGAVWTLPGVQPPGRGGRFGRRKHGSFEQMLEETAARGCSTMLVSTEVLSQPGIPARLVQIFKGHAVEVISYLRRQDRYIEARYNQRIKDGRLKYGLAEFAGEHLARNALDYHAHFTRWAEAFGRESLRIRLYERERFPDGDVRRDFLEVIGVEASGLVFEEVQRNVSLSFAGVEFLRRFNTIPQTRPHRRRVVRLLAQYGAKNPPHSSLLGMDERRAIMDRYRDSNRRFAQEFLGAESVYEIPDAELAREASLDREYGETQFIDMLSFVLPRLLSLQRKPASGLRKKRKKDRAGARKGKGKNQRPADAGTRR